MFNKLGVRLDNNNDNNDNDDDDNDDDDDLPDQVHDPHPQLQHTLGRCGTGGVWGLPRQG